MTQVVFAPPLSAGAQVLPGARLRATFRRTLFGAGAAWGGDVAEATSAYQRLADALPASKMYAVSQPAVSEDGKAFSVDVRRNTEGVLISAQSVAQALELAAGVWGPDPYRLERLALIGAGEGSANADADRTAQAEESAARPTETALDALLSKLGGLGEWVLWVLVLVAIIAVAFLFK